MAQVPARPQIITPCVKVCIIGDASGLCIGCLRTMTEIAGWTRLADAKRAAMMVTLPVRGERLKKPPPVHGLQTALPQSGGPIGPEGS